MARLVNDLVSMGVKPDVVVDPDPFGPTNPWRCAREAWGRTPKNATHRVLLQDDALICDGFPRAARNALTAQPDVVVSFFVNWIGHVLGRAQLQACERCDAWAELPRYGWYPTVALAMPREKALSLANHPVPERVIADDVVIARWALANRERVLQTVPSLVQHDETAISTVAGHNRPVAMSRAAVCFIGDEPHAAIDWTRGP